MCVKLIVSCTVHQHTHKVSTVLTPRVHAPSSKYCLLCVLHTLCALQGVTNEVMILGSASEEEGEFSDLDVSFDSSRSIYIPTPQRNLWANRISLSVPIPDRVCFVELKQLDSFVQQINSCRHCVTPGCSGDLVPSSVKTIGLGGAVSITFSCNAMVVLCNTFHSKVLSNVMVRQK